MKNFIKILTLISFLQFIPIMSMEQGEDKPVAKVQDNHSNSLESDLIGGLPNETWQTILYFVYFGLDFLDKCKDIYEALDSIKIKFLPECSKNIRLICKTFDSINSSISKDLLREQLEKFYRSLFAEKFLELRDGGLYPKGDNWCLDRLMNERIGIFLFTRDKDDDLVFSIIGHENLDLDLQRKIIALLLSCNANPNIKDRQGVEALAKSVAMHMQRNGYDMSKIIKMLLYHGSNVNNRDNDTGYTALDLAIYKHNCDRDMTEIIKMLLDNGANPNTQDNRGDTALERAIGSHYASHDMKPIIRMLLVYGANVYVSLGCSRSTIGLAEEHGINLDELRKADVSKID